MKKNYFTYFDIINLEKNFKNKVRKNNSKGIDKRNSKSYDLVELTELYLNINNKIINDSFSFSPYLELLKVKNRTTPPRLISIPTVKDKIVLTSLKNILHDEFPECINKNQPNCYINKIKKFTLNNKSENYYFTKIDINKFYDEIDRKILLKKLKLKIKNKAILNLILKSINTPTVPSNYYKNDIGQYYQTKGIPQGLPISNILAQIYLNEFDDYVKSFINENETIYLRYVDDILIISTNNEKDWKCFLKNRLKKELKLVLNENKTELGIWDKSISYLGYLISPNIISISNKTIENQINKIAGKITWFKKGSINKLNRPYNLQDDDIAFEKKFIKEVNTIITGSKSLKKNYGWIFYFIELNDITVLFRLDNIIENMILNCKYFNKRNIKKIKKTVLAYFEIKHNSNTNYINNYDSLTTPKQKEKYLKSIGFLDKNSKYDAENIEIKFNDYLQLSLKDIDDGFKY